MPPWTPPCCRPLSLTCFHEKIPPESCAHSLVHLLTLHSFITSNRFHYHLPAETAVIRVTNNLYVIKVHRHVLALTLFKLSGVFITVYRPLPLEIVASLASLTQHTHLSISFLGFSSAWTLNLGVPQLPHASFECPLTAHMLPFVLITFNSYLQLLSFPPTHFSCSTSSFDYLRHLIFNQSKKNL